MTAVIIDIGQEPEPSAAEIILACRVKTLGDVVDELNKYFEDSHKIEASEIKIGFGDARTRGEQSTAAMEPEKICEYFTFIGKPDGHIEDAVVAKAFFISARRRALESGRKLIIWRDMPTIGIDKDFDTKVTWKTFHARCAMV